MDEIQKFVADMASQRRVRTITEAWKVPQRHRRNYRPAYAIANEFGSLFLINRDGTVVRKSNIPLNRDHTLSPPNVIQIFEEISQSSTTKITVQIGDGANVSLMYCHRPVQRLDNNCKKILLCGPTCLNFGPVENIAYSSLNPSDYTLKRTPVLSDVFRFNLSDQDQIILSGRNNLEQKFSIRISSEKHRIYIDSIEALNECVRFRSDDNDSFQKFLEFRRTIIGSNQNQQQQKATNIHIAGLTQLDYEQMMKVSSQPDYLSMI
ncbi:hypothetical protein SSS_01889 [Sarcoptes scabiei]|uniref:Uncharacterized protein n=1 Tax=Sarcoptes scabiei TaxID=52283 RepID=A0A132AEE1_SARSC|nr:hypothetical protein SSS_01889 [Sarcoptes scabiei]KPM08915.1 hypothetical protein QR98_0074410 [Sarcoptes scabiei]